MAREEQSTQEDGGAAPTPALQYARSARPAGLGRLAAAAVAIAVLCFPVGAGLSIFLERAFRSSLIPYSLAEWSGFLTFGIGAACGLCLSVYGVLPRQWHRATSTVRVAFVVAMVLNLGAFATAVVLLVRWKG